MFCSAVPVTEPAASPQPLSPEGRGAKEAPLPSGERGWGEAAGAGIAGSPQRSSVLASTSSIWLMTCSQADHGRVSIPVSQATDYDGFHFQTKRSPGAAPFASPNPLGLLSLPLIPS